MGLDDVEYALSRILPSGPRQWPDWSGCTRHPEPPRPSLFQDGGTERTETFCANAALAAQASITSNSIAQFFSRYCRQPPPAVRSSTRTRESHKKITR